MFDRHLVISRLIPCRMTALSICTPGLISVGSLSSFVWHFRREKGPVLSSVIGISCVGNQLY